MKDALVLILISALTVAMTIGLGLTAVAAIPGLLGVIAGLAMIRLNTASEDAREAASVTMKRSRRPNAFRSSAA